MDYLVKIMSIPQPRRSRRWPRVPCQVRFAKSVPFSDTHVAACAELLGALYPFESQTVLLQTKNEPQLTILKCNDTRIQEQVCLQLRPLRGSNGLQSRPQTTILKELPFRGPQGDRSALLSV